MIPPFGTLADIGADIGITPEDGLRLSELQGRIADAEYHLAHMVTSNMIILFVSIMVTLLAVTMVSTTYPSWREWKCEYRYMRYADGQYRDDTIPILTHATDTPHVPTDRDIGVYYGKGALEALRAEYGKAVRNWYLSCTAVCALVFVLSYLMCFFCTKSFYEAEIASCTAQIDAILGLYGVMS